MISGDAPEVYESTREHTTMQIDRAAAGPEPTPSDEAEAAFRIAIESDRK